MTTTNALAPANRADVDLELTKLGAYSHSDESYLSALVDKAVDYLIAGDLEAVAIVKFEVGRFVETRTTRRTAMMISERYWKGSQSVNGELVVKELDRVLRVTVKRDAYEAQSFGRVELWSGVRWEALLDRILDELECRKASTQDIVKATPMMARDCKTLLSAAVAILAAAML